MPLGKKCGSSVSEGLTWTLYRRGFVRYWVIAVYACKLSIGSILNMNCLFITWLLATSVGHVKSFHQQQQVRLQPLFMQQQQEMIRPSQLMVQGLVPQALQQQQAMPMLKNPYQQQLPQQKAQPQQQRQLVVAPSLLKQQESSDLSKPPKPQDQLMLRPVTEQGPPLHEQKSAQKGITTATTKAACKPTATDDNKAREFDVTTANDTAHNAMEYKATSATGPAAIDCTPEKAVATFTTAIGATAATTAPPATTTCGGAAFIFGPKATTADEPRKRKCCCHVSATNTAT
ncbi:hypothetical protein MRX96_025976 [Rhipicephalus microplus]